MVAAWAWGFSGSGHMVAIKGYEDYSSTTSNGYVLFNDPNDQEPVERRWSYSQFKSSHSKYNYSNTWVATVRDIRP
jgi:hypothetical protein